jgi:hypothetical protein
LAGANLSEASLAGANLYGSNLTGVNFTQANLTGANLLGANLIGVSLFGANLTRANLTRANLTGADLAIANLSEANLTGANLTGTSPRRANLSKADLTEADLTGANLTGTNLSGAKPADLIIARTRILPQGSIIGWKKCEHGVLVKLRIPEKAKRSHAFGRKCRAEWAEVLEVIGGDGVGISQYDKKVRYVAGRVVKAATWDDNWQEECTGGIHFYITREEAEAH